MTRSSSIRHLMYLRNGNRTVPRHPGGTRINPSINLHKPSDASNQSGGFTSSCQPYNSMAPSQTPLPRSSLRDGCTVLWCARGVRRARLCAQQAGASQARFTPAQLVAIYISIHTCFPPKPYIIDDISRHLPGFGDVMRTVRARSFTPRRRH